jgi:hypothetical protein
VEGDQETKTGHLLGQHKELRQEATPEHLGKAFQPHPSQNEPEEEEALIPILVIPYQLEPPINNLNLMKSSGYNLIIGNILRELHTIGIKYVGHSKSNAQDFV